MPVMPRDILSSVTPYTFCEVERAHHVDGTQRVTAWSDPPKRQPRPISGTVFACCRPSAEKIFFRGADMSQLRLFFDQSDRLTVPAPAGWHDTGPASVTIETAMQVCHRDRRTVTRWRKADRIPDPLCVEALQRWAFGMVGHPAWRLWRFTPGGDLDHPELKRPLCELDARQAAFELSRLRATLAQVRSVETRGGVDQRPDNHLPR